jgi:hypothetical protein
MIRSIGAPGSAKADIGSRKEFRLGAMRYSLGGAIGGSSKFSTKTIVGRTARVR